MSTTTLDHSWQLCRLDDAGTNGWNALLHAFDGVEGVYPIKRFPMQVHDVLLEQGVIENPNERGINRDTWIHDKDWAYLCRFRAKTGLPSQLLLRGVDTFADVWLNGTLLGSCDDVYLSWRFDTANLLAEDNLLIVRFHSALKRLETLKLPEKYRGLVPAISAARVFRTGFHDYCGPSPCLIRCGLYDQVQLLQAEPLVLTCLSCGVEYDAESDRGTVDLTTTWLGDGQAGVTVDLMDATGASVAHTEFLAHGGMQRSILNVPSPRRWYPWTHGEPAVYTLRVRGGGDETVRMVGFRTLQIDKKLTLTVNGRIVRAWGANLMHLDTLTNCYDAQKMRRMLDLVCLANCNMLRVWGEADRLPDAFYDECDRRGILVWQDFFLGCSLYSEEESFMQACGAEAEQLISERKHHPSVALWCGGNELYLARDYQHPEAPCFGERIVREVYPAVCQRCDPSRLYYTSSPCGGAFANDPQIGDTHGYTHLWFVPGRRFPRFLSENCRVSAPTYRSMLRMMKPEELWPAGYHAGITREQPYEWPESWNAHTPNEGWRKLGPVERYDDAQNARQMVERTARAHGEYIREQVSDFRRGYAGDELNGNRQTAGHLLWRLNDNSNVISFGVVDYFLEPGHAFYEMKRCYAPLFVSVELSDHAYVWVTNDSAAPVRGRLQISLFHLTENRTTREMELPFEAESDDSRVICSLDAWGQFRKENVIWVRAIDDSGNCISETMQPCDIERRLPYPTHTGLSITCCGNELVLRCERYARCVELSGDENGDSFGWVFEDNFFDLIPGETKRVKVLGEHRSGEITACAVYDRQTACCVFEREEQ